MSGKRTTTAVAAPAVRKTRRSESNGAGVRSVARGASSLSLDVAARHPLLPSLQSPTSTVPVDRIAYERLLSIHLAESEPLIARIVNASGELYVGTGPVPVSRFAELDDLWCATSHQFDNTGHRSFGGMLRRAGHDTFMKHGEFFGRRRDRFDAPEFDRLEVPMEWEIHGSQFCPLDYTKVDQFGRRWQNGVAYVRSKPVAYQFWTDDPFEPAYGRRLMDLDRSEIYHVFDPTIGATRGRPILAPALLRAIKMTTLEDSELRRKQVASLMSVFAIRPVDASDDESMLPTDEEVDDMLDAVALTPGGVFQLPYGFDIKTFEPKDEGANFERALRWQVMMICMSVGIPMNEVMGDEGVERWGRMMSQRVQRQADLVHDMYEHQFLNRMRADFIDSAIEAGLWTPPADLRPWEMYQCDWQWPVIPAARLDQELKTLMEAVEKGYIPHSQVVRTLFGGKASINARVGARDFATLQALGHQASKEAWQPDTDVATRISDRAVAEETVEQDLADAAALEDSVLD